MLRTLFSVLILLSGAVSLTVPQVWAAETTQSKKEKKKQSAKEKREAAKAKREAAKAKKAEEKARKAAAKKAAAAQGAFEQTVATSTVGKALKEIQYVGAARPDVTAEYYFVVRSSSTCPHCVKLLPEVMAAYTEMRATGKVELIYESFDNSAKAAEQHMNKNGIRFPVSMRAHMGNLPGAAPLMVPPPAAYVIDATGKRLASGPLAPVLADWRKLTVDKEEN